MAYKYKLKKAWREAGREKVGRQGREAEGIRRREYEARSTDRPGCDTITPRHPGVCRRAVPTNYVTGSRRPPHAPLLTYGDVCDAGEVYVTRGRCM